MFMQRNVLMENRQQAGEQLAERLESYRDGDVVVLGIPRGGIPVAVPVAERLTGELDVIIVKKLGAPGNSELAIGAVGEDGKPYLNDELVATLGIESDYIESETKKQHGRVDELAAEFRAVREPANLREKTVILVDDGIATGATARACLELIRRKDPSALVLAVPVAPAEVMEDFRSDSPADSIVCLYEIDGFFGGIGGYYRDFSQVSSDQVRQALKRFSPSD